MSVTKPSELPPKRGKFQVSREPHREPAVTPNAGGKLSCRGTRTQSYNQRCQDHMALNFLGLSFPSCQL